MFYYLLNELLLIKISKVQVELLNLKLLSRKIQSCQENVITCTLILTGL